MFPPDLSTPPEGYDVHARVLSDESCTVPIAICPPPL